MKGAEDSGDPRTQPAPGTLGRREIVPGTETESAETAGARPPVSGLIVTGATAAGAVLFGGIGFVIANVRMETREYCELDCFFFNLFLWVPVGLGFGILLALRSALRVERTGALRARVLLAASAAFVLGAMIASWAAVQIDERPGGPDQSQWMLVGALVAGSITSVIAGWRRAHVLRDAEGKAG